MRRRAARRIAAALALLALTGALLVGLNAGALTSGAFRDHFAAASFAGDDGDLPWSGPWEEIGESDGPLAGAIRVNRGVGCTAGNCMELGTFTGSDGVGVQRSADLTGSTTATLGFSYLRVLKAGGGSIAVSVSATGGPPWTTLRSYPLTLADALRISESMDISSYIGAATTIRLMISGDDVKSRFILDDVEIVAEVSATTTTVPVTTTTAAPTTTTVPATTTTVAPTTTTVPATTTTAPWGTSTTTTVPATTTTAPWGTSTTTAPTTTSVPATTTTTQPPVRVTTTVAGGTAGTTTTTTDPGAAITEPPQTEPATTIAPSVQERPTGDRPTMGLALAGNAPGPEDPAEEETVGVLRPLTRMTAVFATGTETISSPPVAIAILAMVVAWLSVRGLERAPRSRRILIRRRTR